jgi:hypothetical protein
MKGRRVTIVARDHAKPTMDWNSAGPEREHVAFVGSPGAIRFALAAAVEVRLDIHRVIVDRTGTTEEFLDLLTVLPEEFNGDVLGVRDDGTGVLSATGRGGGRVLYGLMAADVRFYLEVHRLVTGRVMLEKTA